MKLSDWKQTDTTGYRPAILWFWTLILLVAPNIGLEITDTLLPSGYGGTIARLGFTFLPLGCYVLLLTLSPRIGKSFWISFPLIFLSAFQMVLLDLFGSQPIAVDMWLNLVTTNATEATELLGSMSVSIILITVVYIPAIRSAIIATRRHWTLPLKALRSARRNGTSIALTGLILTVAACIISPSISLLKSLYPVNVVYNACVAADRTAKVARYHTTSAEDSYGATSMRPDSLPEVYVIVVGETARADHFQLYGYGRPTTPRLQQHSGQQLVHFPNTLSESNTTHKSVPMLLSYLDARTFEDSIYTSKGVLTAMREAGFTTVFISNQGHNGSFIDFFGEEADSVTFIRDTYNGPDAAPHDTDILPRFESALKSGHDRKLAIVLHTYGSHFKYDDRYPDDFETPFHVEGHLNASPDDRDNLINAYDNTIAYTDLFLSSVIDMLEATGRPAAMVYASDHGEDIYDDRLERFLHASPLPTWHQVRVPMLVWCSSAFNSLYPEAIANAKANAPQAVSSTRSIFHTYLDLAGISSPRFHPEQSVVNSSYQAPERPLYLNDHNEPVDLTDIVITP